MSRTGWLTALVFAFMVAASGTALAQEGGGGGGGQDGGRGGRGGGRGNFDPAQARERMMQYYKENLAASDEDWKVIQPKLEKVMAAQGATRGGGGFGGFGGGGRGRGGDGGGDRGGDREQTPVAKAASDLRTALQSKDTPADDVAKRLESYRAARTKAREDLAAAQKELKEVLTGRQEAQLVIAGMLE